ncbi:hypothetical protein BESB_059600 [Besnoitia besnoiti]|uniref:Uncharacterized protein n=1 Tax=Besnoitia besnoiti TaxID=94643 RepID=A0A2A9MHE3_BESBE|nr:hypothetical protein BESB_059600 [Besnoitia besnoiti]PFH35073.1 hypothetical protein BESB_059600 [Besnoitia besnoiti]
MAAPGGMPARSLRASPRQPVNNSNVARSGLAPQAPTQTLTVSAALRSSASRRQPSPASSIYERRSIPAAKPPGSGAPGQELLRRSMIPQASPSGAPSVSVYQSSCARLPQGAGGQSEGSLSNRSGVVAPFAQSQAPPLASPSPVLMPPAVLSSSFIEGASLEQLKFMRLQLLQEQNSHQQRMAQLNREAAELQETLRGQQATVLALQKKLVDQQRAFQDELAAIRLSAPLAFVAPSPEGSYKPRELAPLGGYLAEPWRPASPHSPAVDLLPHNNPGHFTQGDAARLQQLKEAEAVVCESQTKLEEVRRMLHLAITEDGEEPSAPTAEASTEAMTSAGSTGKPQPSLSPSGRSSAGRLPLSTFADSRVSGGGTDPTPSSASNVSTGSKAGKEIASGSRLSGATPTATSGVPPSIGGVVTGGRVGHSSSTFSSSGCLPHAPAGAPAALNASTNSPETIWPGAEKGAGSGLVTSRSGVSRPLAQSFVIPRIVTTPAGLSLNKSAAKSPPSPAGTAPTPSGVVSSSGGGPSSLRIPSGALLQATPSPLVQSKHAETSLNASKSRLSSAVARSGFLRAPPGAAGGECKSVALPNIKSSGVLKTSTPVAERTKQASADPQKSVLNASATMRRSTVIGQGAPTAASQVQFQKAAPDAEVMQGRFLPKQVFAPPPNLPTAKLMPGEKALMIPVHTSVRLPG